MKVEILWAVLLDPIPVEARYSCGSPHHVTLIYGVTDPELWRDWVGMEFEAQVWAEAWDDRIQALRVHLPEGIPYEGQDPHLTVSYREGVEPVESNAMLQGIHQERAWEGILRLRVELRGSNFS
jgi:hypothetical protein